MSTIKDVAKKAGVSAATVSIVLNDNKSNLPISEATKRRVRKAAEALGYRPNTYAKALRTQKSYVIGILAFDIVDPYCAHVLRGAEDVLNKKDYYPMISDLQNDESNLRNYVRLFQDRRVEGLLVLASSLQVDDQLIYDIHNENIPLVVIGRDVNDLEVSTVVTDNVSGSFQATEHLVQLGHRDISFILGPSRYVDSRQRWEGSQKALSKYGIDIESDLLIEEKDVGWGPEAGYHSMKELFKKRKKITAVVAFDDISAFGAIRAITEEKLKVPDDISVVGFDDIPAASFYNPPLTTIQYSMVEMGRMGSELLISQLSGDKAQKQLMPESKIIIRNSTTEPRM